MKSAKRVPLLNLFIGGEGDLEASVPRDLAEFFSIASDADCQPRTEG